MSDKDCRLGLYSTAMVTCGCIIVGVVFLALDSKFRTENPEAVKKGTT